MMDLIVKGLSTWFADRLQGMPCTPETTAYVAGVLAKRRTEDDMSTESLVLAYHAASIIGDFAGFQRIGDYVLWIDSIYPEFINDHRQVIETIGRQSYSSCHRILKGQWKIYDELAQTLPLITATVRQKLV